MHPELDVVALKRALTAGRVILVILLVAGILLSSVKPFTEYLWYTKDVGQPQVFTTAYETRGWLFIASLLISWGVLYANLRKALGMTLVYLREPESSGQVLIGQAIQWVQQRGGTVLRFGAPVFAFFTALGFSNEWNTYLLWRNGGRFGMPDPMYGLDLGFYAFSLPWYRAVTNGFFSLLLLTTLLTIGAYIGMQSLAAMAKIELSRPGFRWHVNGLIGATLIAFALQTWLKTYEAGLIDSVQFTGAGYAASQAVFLTRVFAGLAAAVGIATIFGARFGRPYGIPMAGGLGLVVFYAVVVAGYPELVQRFVVIPNRLVREAPYASRAIRMSRFAYGLDKIETRDSEVKTAPTPEEVAAAKPTLDNMRLWDPVVLKQSLERQQAVRPYYHFPDVDIDRYLLDGSQTMVMLSPRNVDLDGLDAEARNWTNERLRYTHGYGVAVAQVNAATADGQPVFLDEDIPQRSSPQLPITQPRIYFSNLNAEAPAVDPYALVDTAEPELDYQTGSSSQTSQWSGERGVPIGGLMTRLAYSITLGDGSLLVSGNVGANTRLLVHRDVIDRASHVYPFLKFDHDPYLVILNGKLVWILDGYTMTDMVPYAARLVGPEAAVNYIRNPVKATVDAYSGETTAYAIDPNEPILSAYRRIYPGLIRDASEIPAGLAAHFRYPEDLLSLQCSQLTNYHVQDPTAFLSNSDAWDIASERDLDGNKAQMPPYYVEMRLPDEPTTEFMQILPFTPRGRQTMSGWIAAHCDPSSYGRLTLYRFAAGADLPGPELMEGNFTSTPEISNINRQFNNDQSEIVVGNLLVIPIGHSMMYAEPLYLRSKASGIKAAPRLFRVILALSDKIVVAESYPEALGKLFGATPIPSAVAAPSPTSPSAPVSVREAATQALDLFRQADAALRAGDFAKYGALQKELKARLEQLVR